MMTMILRRWLLRYVYDDDDLDEVVDGGDDHPDENEKLTAMTVTPRGPGALLLHHKSSPTMLQHQHFIQDITTTIYQIYIIIYNIIYPPPGYYIRKVPPKDISPSTLPSPGYI